MIIETADYKGEERLVTPVEPVKHDYRKGRKNVRYTYNKIHHAELESVAIQKVSLYPSLEGTWWHYEKKTPILLTDGQVYRPESAEQEDAERQAYYALSYMDSQGLVDRFKKR